MTDQSSTPEVPSRDPEDQEFADAEQQDIPAVAGGDDDTAPAQGEGETNSY